LWIAVAKYAVVAVIALVAYEAVVHRFHRDWDSCKIIKVYYAQSIPTSGSIVWNLAIYPETGAWNFHGTRRLEAFLELPAHAGRPFGEGVGGAETVELKGTLRPEAALGLVSAALERDADVLGRWLERFATRWTHMPRILVEVQVDGRSIGLENPEGVPSQPLEDLARHALTLTVLANSDDAEAQPPR
jgi:hypothetical protein